MTEKTVLQLIRESLESKLFPPKPKGWTGEKIHSLTIKEDIRKTAIKYTGRPIEEPKKEKEGD